MKILTEVSVLLEQCNAEKAVLINLAEEDFPPLLFYGPGVNVIAPVVVSFVAVPRVRVPP